MKVGIALLSMIGGFAYSHEICLKEEPYNYWEKHAHKQTPLYLIEKFRFLGNETVLIFDSKQEKLTKKLSRLLPHGSITQLYPTENIQNLQLNFPKWEYENIHFVQGALSDLKYPHQYDLIFAFDSFGFNDDFNENLKKIEMSLKLSGAVAFTLLFNLPPSIEESLKQLIHSEKWREYFSDLKEVPVIDRIQEIEQQLKQNGFAIDLIEKREEKITFNTQEEFLDFIKPKITQLHHIPEDKRAEFLSDLFNDYNTFEKIDFLNTQTIELHVIYLAVIAHKL